MDFTTETTNRDTLSREEKKHQLFLKQKKLLGLFLARGAITQAQHDRSLHDLTVKMGEEDGA